MTDYYLSDVAEETGKLFEYWANNNMDMDKMVTNYMKSHFRANVDKRYAKFCTQMWYDMAEHFDGIEGKDQYDFVLCNWLGQFYTYLQEYTGKSSDAIISEYPFNIMYPRSNTLHDLDMKLAVKKVGGSR